MKICFLTKTKIGNWQKKTAKLTFLFCDILVKKKSLCIGMAMLPFQKTTRKGSGLWCTFNTLTLHVQLFILLKE